MRHIELLHEQLRADLNESGERTTTVEIRPNIENEGAIDDDLDKDTKHVHHGLEPLTVVGDGEFALHEVVELCIETEGMSLPVGMKLSCNGKPDGSASCDAF